MELQTNPYLIWQLISGFITLGIALYIQTRPVKKRESLVFSLLMFGGALWAFANALQLISPDINWQRTWNNITYLGIMTVPTAWFLLSVKLTGFMRERMKKVEMWLWYVPSLLYATLLTNNYHNLFFKSYEMTRVGRHAALSNNYGALFFVHTAYSYVLMISGILILAISLATNFKRYGTQAYGLLIGVLAPLVGNAYFLFGTPPASFPDPTPIIFTVTGLAFAWAIFGGHLLEVVPLAHDTIVRKLSTGVLILDAEKNIRDINPAAREMLGLSSQTFPNDSLSALAEKNSEIASVVNNALDESVKDDQDFQITFSETMRTFDMHVSHIGDNRDNTTGWLIQFSDISEKKQAEENLTKTLETLDSVLDTLQDSYFEADPQGMVTYANKALIENLGFSSREDVQGKHFRNFTNHNSIRDLFEKHKILYATGQPLPNFEYSFRRKDGSVRIAEASISPILKNGNVIGSRGMLRDIVDRVEAEKEIAAQKDFLDSLVQNSPIAIVINNMDGIITIANPAFENLFGYTHNETLGGKLDHLISTPERLDEMKTLTSLGMQKRTYNTGKRKKKDSSLIDINMVIEPFYVSGKQYGSMVFIMDVSEQIKTKADLEKTRSSFFAVIETLQDAYFEALPSGYLVYVNQAFCNACGYPREEIIGKHFRQLTTAKSFRETVKKFELMFETRQPVAPFNFFYQHKDGRSLVSEIVVSPIIDDGKIVGTRGVIRDISIRIEAEELLRQAKEAAEDRAGELAMINRISEVVSGSLEMDNILQSVCRELTTIFEIRNAGIGLLTPDRKNLEIVAFHTANHDEKSALGLVLPVEGNTSSKEVLEKKRTIVIQDAQNDPRTSTIADISKTRGTRSIMIVPLLARGEAIGTIGMPAKNPDYIFTDNEIKLAETIASQIATAIDNARLHEKTESALDVAERDLEIGRQIQSGFFPEKLPELPGWEIATHFQAARQVAGDFYDIFQFKNSNFTAFIVADVCDKGVGAALFMVLFRSLLRAFSEIKINKGNVREQLLNIIENTNNFIAEYHGKSNMFATLFFGILDPDTGIMYYVNGGHEPPAIFGQNGNIIQRLMPTGPAVGMFPDMVFDVEHIQFNKGDFLVGFTDGVTDAKNTSGKQFTEDRLLKYAAYPWTSVFSMLFELNIELQNHIGEQNQFDDITLISFRRNTSANDGHHAICRTAQLSALTELRDFVESAAIHSGLKHDDVFAFKLAVDEICTNIIQYGYEGREAGSISLFFDVEKDQARLIIQDDGIFFSPEQAQDPDIEADWNERQVGGLGIFFVQELMDNVIYNQVNGNINRFVLEKKLITSNTTKE